MKLAHHKECVTFKIFVGINPKCGKDYFTCGGLYFEESEIQFSLFMTFCLKLSFDGYLVASFFFFCYL